MMSRVPLTLTKWRCVEAHLLDAGFADDVIDAVKDAFVLDKKERGVLRKIQQPKWRCRPVDAELRSKVHDLKSKGLSQRKIAQQVGRGKGTIQYVLNQLKQLQ